MWDLRGIFIVSIYMAIAWSINIAVYWLFIYVCRIVILYIDYSSSAVGHICAMLQAYLFRVIYQ